MQIVFLNIKIITYFTYIVRQVVYIIHKYYKLSLFIFCYFKVNKIGY